MNTTTIDNVAHYDGDECMKAIEECGLARGFILGSMLKYAWRHGRKDPTEVAMGKALWYLRRGIANGRLDAMSLADRYVVERFLGLVSGEPEAAEVIAEAKAWLDAAARKAPAPSMYEVIEGDDGFYDVFFKGKRVTCFNTDSSHVAESFARQLTEAYLIGYGEQLGSDVIAHSDHWHAEVTRLAGELEDARSEASTTIAELYRQLERSRELRHRLEAAVAQRDELGIRCAEAQRKAEVLARQVERIQADRDELAGHATDLQRRLDELDDVERERDALRRHYDAAAPEHNLLALLDLYMSNLRSAEDELDRMRRIEAAATEHVADIIEDFGEYHEEERRSWLALKWVLKCGTDAPPCECEDTERGRVLSPLCLLHNQGEDEVAAPQPEADEWPLLCVEEIDVDGDTSYRVLDDGEAPPDGCRAFRCRLAAQGFEWPSMEERSPEIELGPEATEEDVAYHLCYDPRLAAALSQPGETVLLDDYDHRVNAAPEADEWPLLCAARVPMDGELHYRVLRSGESAKPGVLVRRCRRVPGSKVVNTSVLVAHAIEDAADVGAWRYDGAFANWDAVNPKARPGAEEALKRWADEWLEVDAFELGPEVDRG